MVTLQDIRLAKDRISPAIFRTPLVRYFAPSIDHTHASGEEFFFKPENMQPIGSFKLRGAFNKIASLTPDEHARGVITYSSGNHAQGVAYAARALKTKAVIVMPRNAPRVKRDATIALGADIVEVGVGSDERKLKAEELSREHGYVIVPPFDDEQIIAGQGTIGLEIFQDLHDVELVLVPIGGGGLSSGVAAAMKLSGSKAKVIGVEPALANDAQQSLQAGKIVQIASERAASTLADGLRTQSIGELNFEHLSRFLDGIVIVAEDEIRKAMRCIARDAHMVVEPSGAVTTAAWMFHRDKLPSSSRTVAIVSGGNVEPQLLAEILTEDSSRR